MLRQPDTGTSHPVQASECMTAGMATGIVTAQLVCEQRSQSPVSHGQTQSWNNRNIHDNTLHTYIFCVGEEVCCLIEVNLYKEQK